MKKTYMAPDCEIVTVNSEGVFCTSVIGSCSIQNWTETSAVEDGWF